MSEPLAVGLLFGGRSVEHEVSLQSARGVLAALERTPHRAVPIAVTGEGAWLGPERSGAILRGTDARAEAAGDAARVLPDPGGRRLLRVAPGRPPAPLNVDVVLPLVHGRGGEDGRLQGALDLADIPYAGPGVLGSALAMDKAAAKLMLRAAGLPVVAWVTLGRDEADEAASRRIAQELGFPVFVKPANGGSSVGVSRVEGPATLAAALAEAFDCDHKILVERAVDAREIECAVIGNDAPEASVPGEILPSRAFYDYTAKYLDGTSGLVIPAALDPATSRHIAELAVAAFRALGLAGFARIDFLLERSSGQAYVNEANTLPGFTTISMFPKLWEASGLSYPRLIERLLELALERSRADAALRTRWRGEGVA